MSYGWAAKAAHKILDSLHYVSDGGDTFADAYIDNSVEEITAIIATFAEPLMALLRESRREHRTDDEGYCPRNYPDHWPASKRPCNCGADEWNARVDAVLDEEGKLNGTSGKVERCLEDASDEVDWHVGPTDRV